LSDKIKAKNEGEKKINPILDANITVAKMKLDIEGKKFTHQAEAKSKEDEHKHK